MFRFVQNFQGMFVMISDSIEVKIKYSLHSNFYLLPWFR